MDLIMPVLVALLGTFLVGLIGYLVYMALSPVEENDYIDQLKEIVDDGSADYKKKDGIVSKWNNYWGKLLGESEIERYALDDKEKSGREVIMLFVGIFFVSMLLLRNPVLPLAIVAVAWYVIVFYVRSASVKRTRAIEDQLSGLLFSVKSNLQAGDTNEKALMGVVDAMPNPLKEELTIGRNILLASGTFKEALEAMSAGTSSNDLKFLCSCMIQAASSGASMTMQIDNIQKVLEERRRVSSEIDKAVKSVAPAMWLAGLVIPIMFVVSYFIDGAAQDFWFSTLLGWAGFGIVIALYVAGLVITKNQVDKVRNI